MSWGICRVPFSLISTIAAISVISQVQWDGLGVYSAHYLSSPDGVTGGIFCNPHPKSQGGRGTLNPALLLPFWEKGLGDVELALPEGWANLQS